MLIISLEMMAVIPLAKNIPASVTINGWISMYATRNPCTSPNTIPVISTIRTDGTAPIPPRSIIHASIIQPMATKEPTLMSMPPVIMTTVMPIPITISPALEINRFRKFCVFENPWSLKRIQPITYMTMNSTMVIRRRKLVWFNLRLLFIYAAPFSAAVLSFFWASAFLHFANPGDWSVTIITTTIAL